VIIDKRVKLRQALQEALHRLERGDNLPAYLETALLNYEQAFWAGVTKKLIAPKVVGRFHRQKGRPLSKKSTNGAGAFEAAAEKLGCSESAAERAYYENPPQLEDLDFPKIK
jgi:hypothetical protein